MKNKRINFLVIYVVLLISHISAFTNSDSLLKEVSEALNRNLLATQANDLEATMATIHPQSPSYESSKRILKYLFSKKFKIIYKIINIKIINYNTRSVYVRVTQITRMEKPVHRFKNNRTIILHELKKHNKIWKIYSTRLLQREFID